MTGKISEMTSATSVAVADEVEVLQGGTNKRATLQKVVNLALGTTRNFLATWWYHPFLGLVPIAGSAFSGTIRGLPFVVQQTMTIAAIGAYVTTIGGSGHTVQFAIYANDPATNRPTGAPLASTSNVAVDTTSAGAAAGYVSGTVTAVQLTPGIYWMATNSSNGTAVLQSTVSPVLQSIIGSTSLTDMSGTASTATRCLTFTQTYGTWPTFSSTTGMAIANVNPPVLFIQVQSVP